MFAYLGRDGRQEYGLSHCARPRVLLARPTEYDAVDRVISLRIVMLRPELTRSEVRLVVEMCQGPNVVTFKAQKMSIATLIGEFENLQRLVLIQPKLLLICTESVPRPKG